MSPGMLLEGDGVDHLRQRLARLRARPIRPAEQPKRLFQMLACPGEITLHDHLREAAPLRAFLYRKQ